MSEVQPGSRLWPYHAHHANEEWVIVLRGEPTLRTPEGEHVLKEGDVVAFPRGRDGAHQIINRTDSPVRVLMLSSMAGPDIVDYIDSGKVYATDLAGEPDHVLPAGTHPRLLGGRGLAGAHRALLGTGRRRQQGATPGERWAFRRVAPRR